MPYIQTSNILNPKVYVIPVQSLDKMTKLSIIPFSFINLMYLIPNELSTYNIGCKSHTTSLNTNLIHHREFESDYSMIY